MKKIIFLFYLISCFAYGQKKPFTKFCHSDEVYQESVKKDPSLTRKMNEMNEQILRFAQNQKSSNQRVAQTNYTIPVIVYVVHDNQPIGVGSNISDAQVQSQITALNNYVSGTGLKFCLGTKAGNQSLLEAAGNLPTANSTTPGIVHINNSTLANHTIANESNLISGTSGYTLSQNKYLRIWVVKSINGANSGIGGYSYFPNTAKYLDGIVMDYKYFGSNGTSTFNLDPNYQQGKILTHELGHYLGLRHTFEGGCHDTTGNNNQTLGDLVTDTPPAKEANFGCPTTVVDSCPLDGLNDDISNYMDYTYDACKNHFTTGQKDRMVSHLINYRTNLFDIDNLIYTGVCGSSNMVSSNFTGSLNNDNNYIYNICAGSTMYFKPVTASSSYPAGAVTYAWDFGNGTTSTTENATTVYATSSNNFYTVTLTVTYNGVNSVSTKKLYVNNCTPIVNEESTWYYNYKNIIKFNSGVPRTNGTITFPGDGWSPRLDFMDNLFEGVCLQNDNNGIPLFFTDGKDVFNGQNPATKINPVPLKCRPEVGSPLILKLPNNPNKYYIFHSLSSSGVGHFFPASNCGFRYSIVNINSGIPSMSVNEINIPITPNSSQVGYLTSTDGDNAFATASNIKAIEKIDGGYWIFSTVFKTDGTTYLSVFEFSNTGVISLKNVFKTPFTSSTSYPDIRMSDKIATSPNGDKLFFHWLGTIPIMLDFDKYTGTLSQTSIFKNYNSYTNGIVFSPDSHLVYLNNGQIDINTPLISENTSSIKLGNIFDFINAPDGKIYYLSSPNSKTTLGVLHKPNQIVTANDSNAFLNQPDILKPEFDLINLSNYQFSKYIVSKKASAYNVNQISTYKVGCNAYKFFPDVMANPTNPSFVWNFGDSTSGVANTSTANTPTHTFSTSGTYTVTVTLEESNSPIATTQVTVDAFTTPAIQGTSTQCLKNGSSTTFNSVSLQNGQSVVWSIIGGKGTILTNNQAEVQINWTQLPGIIQAVITDPSGCTGTATKTITLTPSVTPTFTQVAPICAGSALNPLPTTSNTGGITGTWSPALNNMATTTYTFTPNTNYCAIPVTMTIVVNPLRTPTFNQVAPICQGTTPTLPTQSNEGITGSWALTSSTSSAVIYTFTPNSGQCTSATLTTISISLLPANDPSCITNNCQNSIVLSSPETNNTVTYRALNNIETNTNYVVGNTKQVNLKSENSISLKPGTQISNGAIFSGKIQACSDASRTQKLEIRDSSLEEDIQDILLYPNPSDGHITIRTELTKKLMITIYSLEGKTLYNIDWNQNEIALDVSFLRKGIYFAEIKTDSLHKKIKFVRN